MESKELDILNFGCNNVSNDRVLLEQIGKMHNSYVNWQIFSIVNIEEWRALLEQTQRNLDDLKIFINIRRYYEFLKRIESLIKRIDELVEEFAFLLQRRQRRQIMSGVGTFIADLLGFLTVFDGFEIRRNILLLDDKVKKSINLMESHTTIVKSLIDNSREFTQKSNLN